MISEASEELEYPNILQMAERVVSKVKTTLKITSKTMAQAKTVLSIGLMEITEVKTRQI